MLLYPMTLCLQLFTHCWLSQSYNFVMPCQQLQQTQLSLKQILLTYTHAEWVVIASESSWYFTILCLLHSRPVLETVIVLSHIPWEAHCIHNLCFVLKKDDTSCQPQKYKLLLTTHQILSPIVFLFLSLRPIWIPVILRTGTVLYFGSLEVLKSYKQIYHQIWMSEKFLQLKLMQFESL